MVKLSILSVSAAMAVMLATTGTADATFKCYYNSNKPDHMRGWGIHENKDTAQIKAYNACLRVDGGKWKCTFSHCDGSASKLEQEIEKNKEIERKRRAEEKRKGGGRQSGDTPRSDGNPLGGLPDRPSPGWGKGGETIKKLEKATPKPSEVIKRWGM